MGVGPKIQQDGASVIEANLLTEPNQTEERLPMGVGQKIQQDRTSATEPKQTAERLPKGVGQKPTDRTTKQTVVAAVVHKRGGAKQQQRKIDRCRMTAMLPGLMRTKSTRLVTRKTAV